MSYPDTVLTDLFFKNLLTALFLQISPTKKNPRPFKYLGGIATANTPSTYFEQTLNSNFIFCF